MGSGDSFKARVMVKILIVEDDTDLLYLYRTALAQAGYEVQVAATGSAAHQSLQESVPDIVFLDMNMPDMHGLDLLDHMRQDGRYDNTQIVVITANEQWQASAKARNIQLFLVKPVTIRDLVAVAKRLTR